MRVNKTHRLTASVILALLFIVSFSIPVYAAPINTPDILTISYVKCYQPYIEASDQLWLISYTIDYTSIADPTDGTATDLFILSIMDGGTEVASLPPYSAYSSGFNKGILAFYFSADSHPTWGGGTAYDVVLRGNPAYTWTAGAPPSVTYSATLVQWNSYLSIALCQTALTAQLRSAMQNLQNVWNSSSYVLTAIAAKGVVLTTTGEGYLTNVVYEARTYLIDMFQLTENPAVAVEKVYTHSSSDNFLLTGIGTAVDFRPLAIALTGGLVTTQNEMGMFVMVCICLAVIILTIIRGGQFLTGLTIVCFIWMGSGYLRIIHLNYAIAIPIIVCTVSVAWKFAFQNQY